MAKAATDEQVQLRRRARRRLIGAIALVTLIAVVLPWILESEPRTSDQEISIQIPSPDSGAFNTRVLPGKGMPSAKPGVEPSAPPAEASAPASDTDANAPAGGSGVLQAEQDKVLAPPPAKSPPAKEKTAAGKDAKSSGTDAKKNAAEARDASSDGKQFVVQIGALADATKAESLQKALASKGMKSYTEVVKTNAGEVTRVRVGPFSSRELAEEERAKLKALGYVGNVAPR